MSIKARLYPNETQARQFRVHCGHARLIWNLCVEQQNMWIRGKGPTPNAAQRSQQLTELRAEYPWLAEGATVVQQGALNDFAEAQKNWWKGTHKRPKRHKKGVSEGFRVRDLKIKRASKKTGLVQIPKVGWVRFRISRPWVELEQATSARVTLRNGRWHVSFTTPAPKFERSVTERVTGIDRGASEHNTLVLTDGTALAMPGLTARERAKFAHLERQLARQRRPRGQKQSKRYLATKGKMSALRRKLADRRQDFIEQSTTMLVRDYDGIALEKLPVSSMTKAPSPKPDPDNPGAYLPNGKAAKSALNRMILASSWAKFEQRLKHKADNATSPVIIVSVKAAYTSQTCRACGHVASENRESQAVFKCVACGHGNNADVNAAGNILDRAIERNPALAAYAAGPVVNRAQKTHSWAASTQRETHLESDTAKGAAPAARNPRP